MPRNDLYSVPFLDFSLLPRSFPCLMVMTNGSSPHTRGNRLKDNAKTQKFHILLSTSNVNKLISFNKALRQIDLLVSTKNQRASETKSKTSAYLVQVINNRQVLHYSSKCFSSLEFTLILSAVSSAAALYEYKLIKYSVDIPYVEQTTNFTIPIYQQH